jgi:hypothetical protein
MTKLERYQRALKDIENPLAKLQADAKRKGATLEGAYVALLLKDANWLREKARKALGANLRPRRASKEER